MTKLNAFTPAVYMDKINNMTKPTWEEEFDNGCNAMNISDTPSDTVWIKNSFNNRKWK